MNNNERLERVRKKLNKVIEEGGTMKLETQLLSRRADRLISEQMRDEKQYPYNSEMKECYYESYRHLSNLTREFAEFPTTKEWNKYAKEKTLLSHLSMEYISGKSWNKLRDHILLELNMK